MRFELHDKGALVGSVQWEGPGQVTLDVADPGRREYLADAEGVLLTRYPPGLISALKKLAVDTTPMRVANNATAHMWLTQPSRVPGEGHHWYEKLFSTHPPIQDRIRALEEM